MTRPCRRQRFGQSGFTLLEVMIAITIMTVVFATFLTSKSGSILQATQAKELNVAGWLAQKTMAESEHLVEGKPFAELDKEATGQFDAPYGTYKWKREVRELKFPDLAASQKDGAVPETARVMSKVITKYLNDAVRELVVTISWQRGNSEQTVELSTYLVDLEAEFNFSI